MSVRPCFVAHINGVPPGASFGERSAANSNRISAHSVRCCIVRPRMSLWHSSWSSVEQQRDDFCRPANDRTVQRMATGAVDVVDERGLSIQEGTHARQVPGFGGAMDGMILRRRRRHEPFRRIDYVPESYRLPSRYPYNQRGPTTVRTIAPRT
jgi:hypothetical protein